MQKITDKNILNRVLDFKNKAVSYFEKYYAYINLEYIKENSLVLRPDFKTVWGLYEKGSLDTLFKKSNFDCVYILLLNKETRIKTKDYIDMLIKQGHYDIASSYKNEKNKYTNLMDINLGSDVKVFKASIDEINEYMEKDLNSASDYLIFPSLSFDFFILSTYFYYDLICGKKEIVDNFVKMTNKQAIKKLKEIDEDIEDPIRLYNIYGEYFEEKIKNGEK